ncbi:MAG: Transposase IS116/IS110/IS902 family protein [Pelotomaculum sp. PtaU1.Bin035]|nr:MAG: Transposase IS116/IS110/IS902 family protein [Pelotomaculum sp. PtaU1.Bin035]
MKRLVVGPEHLVVGIDIAKSLHWAQFIDPFGKKLGKPYSFQNTREGFENLVLRATACLKEQGLKAVIFGMEPTGHYGKALAEYLVDRGYNFVLVNPMHVKKSKEFADNSPSKNDRKDAYTISKLIRDNNFLMPLRKTGVYADLEEYGKTRSMVIEKIKAVKCQIKASIDQFFPELPTLFRTMSAKSTRWLLATAPFPRQILSMSEEALTNGLKQVSNRHQGLKRARKLMTLAAESIGVRQGSDAAAQRMAILISEYEQYLKEQELIETRLKEAFRETGLAEYIQSIPGVGEITGALFLAEIGDPTNYNNWREIQKLAGLNIRENDSGKHRGKRTITKRGRASLRSLAYQLALMAVVHNKELRYIYDQLTGRSNRPLQKKQALVAISVKVLRIMFVLSKKKTRYQPERAAYKAIAAA